MFLVKENIIKLVKASGQKPRTNADIFFSRQMARESAYEAKFANRTPRQSTSPTSVTPTKTEGSGLSFGILGSMVGVLGGILGGLATAFGSIAAVAGTLAATLGTLFGAVSALTAGLFKILGFILRSRIGKILGLGAAAFGLSKAAEAGKTGIPGMEENTSSPGSSGSFMKDADTAVTYGAGGLAAYGVAKFAQRAIGLGQRTSFAILDAKTTTAKFGKEAPTKWGSFLQFLEKRAPKLFAKFGLRLAQAGALMAIPVAGWILALINLGFTLVIAYQIYSLWKEFTGSPEEQESNQSTSPVEVPSGVGAPSASSTAPVQQSPGSQPSGSASSTAPVQQSPGSQPSGSFNLIGNPSLRSFFGLKPKNESELTFNQLTREQQDAVLKAQREQEGFRPGSLTYELNNPGAILYTPRASAFGGVPDTTGRGAGKLKGKFAKFPTLEDGIEAQRDLWSRKYGNMPIQDVVKMWTGGEQGANSNYANALMAAATGKASAPGLSASSSSSGTQVAQASSAATDAKMQMAAAQPVLFNDIKFIDSLAKASAGSGGGSLDRAMPYDRDWYMGVVRTQAL